VGFLKKMGEKVAEEIKDRFDGDDEKEKAKEAQERSEAEAKDARERAEAEATAVLSSEGKVEGAGLGRRYTTKAGDKLEDIAAYFYGDPVHKQRLIDDNPALSAFDGRELPAGLTINVSEDASRGDAVSST
jgi:hypothetical protein